MYQPLVCCLCPTYRRKPELLANAIACFEAQTYPLSRRFLIVLDDAGEIAPTHGDGWQIVSVPDRYPTLPEKYNALVQQAEGADILAVWEDSTTYLPWHLMAIVASMAPRTHHGVFRDEYVDGPVWAQSGVSLAFRRETFAMIDGWTGWTELAAQLRGFGPPGDPCDNYPPSYVSRNGSTGGNARRTVERGLVIEPKLDEETRALFERLEGE